MARMNAQPDLSGAVEAMKAARRGPRRKSQVYQWLALRHAGLSAAFSASPPSWKALATYLGEGGVMGADGTPASPAAVRAAWLRVMADKARAKSVASPPPPVPTPAVDPASDAPDFDFGSFVKER